MPYKNIIDRRLAWKRWAKKHKKKRQLLNNIQEKARRANPLRQTCSVNECKILAERHHPDYSKPTVIIWLCKLHHELVHHNRRCVICGDKHRARGYCNKHWKKWRKGKL